MYQMGSLESPPTCHSVVCSIDRPILSTNNNCLEQKLVNIYSMIAFAPYFMNGSAAVLDSFVTSIVLSVSCFFECFCCAGLRLARQLVSSSLLLGSHWVITAELLCKQ